MRKYLRLFELCFNFGNKRFICLSLSPAPLNKYVNNKCRFLFPQFISHLPLNLPFLCSALNVAYMMFGCCCFGFVCVWGGLGLRSTSGSFILMILKQILFLVSAHFSFFRVLFFPIFVCVIFYIVNIYLPLTRTANRILEHTFLYLTFCFTITNQMLF